MVFVCPKCKQKALKISSSLELPSDSRSDEISLQILECNKCDFKSLGVYEESKRGAIDSYSFNHQGYIVNYEVLELFREKINECNQPKNSKCSCSVHKYFNRVNDSARWNFLEEIEILGKYNLIISP